MKFKCGKITPIVAATMLLSVATGAHASEASKAAAAFGYAIQAQGWCDEYIVNMKTEGKLEQRFGQKIRGEGSALNGDFMRGTERYMDDHAKVGTETACEKAWDRVGPSGEEFPGLLMKSPFKN